MNSRTKGANGERELAGLIRDHLNVRLVRNLEQSRRGGYDLIPHPDESGPVASWLARYAFECKRHSRATPSLLRGWWAQTCTQAEAVGLVPCLCYRADRADWRVVLPMAEIKPDLPTWDGLDFTMEMSVPAFCAWVRECMGPSGAFFAAVHKAAVFG